MFWPVVIQSSVKSWKEYLVIFKEGCRLASPGREERDEGRISWALGTPRVHSSQMPWFPQLLILFHTVMTTLPCPWGCH